MVMLNHFLVPSPNYLQPGLHAFYYCENGVSEHLRNSLHCSLSDFDLSDERDLCDVLQRESGSDFVFLIVLWLEYLINSAAVWCSTFRYI